MVHNFMTDEEAIKKLKGDKEAVEYVKTELARLREAVRYANIANDRQLSVIYELSDKLKSYDRRGRRQCEIWRRYNV